MNFSWKHFLGASLVCFTAMSKSWANCSIVSDVDTLNANIDGYNANPQTCASPFLFGSMVNLGSSVVTPVNIAGTILLESNSELSIVSGGNPFLQTNTEGVNLQIGSSLQVSGAKYFIAGASLQFNSPQNWYVESLGSSNDQSEFSLSNNALIEFNTSGTIAANFVLEAGQVYIQVNEGNSITYTSSVSGQEGTGIITGAGGLGKIGPGSLVITVDNSYTGGTILSEGVLELEASGGLGSGTLTLGEFTTFLLQDGIELSNSISVEEGSAINVLSGSATLGGPINGNGSLFVGGPGMLILAGTNTYSGGTTLLSNSGQLQLMNNAALGSGILSMNAGSTLMLSQGVTITNQIVVSGSDNIDALSGGTAILAGVISGSGSLLVCGNGTLILGNSNSYTGGTNLETGRLVLSTSSSIGNGTLTLNGGTTCILNGSLSLSNTIVLSGPATIEVDSGTATLSGSINGNYMLTKGGSDSLTLSGNSPSFAGGFSIPGGALIIANNVGINASSPGEVTVASLASTTSPDLSVSLTVNDDMVLNCSVLDNYGLVVVNGEITCTEQFINYGTVSGTGSIEADGITVYEDGVVSPGQSPGTLILFSDTDFLEGSTLSIYLSPTRFSNLIVEGDLLLEGASLRFNPQEGCYVSGQSYEFLNYTGDLSGVFEEIDMGSYLLTPTISYGENLVTLTVDRTNLTTIVTEANALAVAQVLQSNMESNSLFCTELGWLIRSSLGEISAVFSQMGPAQFKGLVIAQENNMVKVRDTLNYRMQVVLDGVHCIGFTKKDPENDSHQKPVCANDQRSFHVWVNGMGDSLDQKSAYFAGSNQVGYFENMGGVVLGMDYRFADYFYAGALGAYTSSNLTWKDSQGTGGVDTGYAGVYFSALSNIFYVNGALIGGFNSFSAKRNIVFPPQTVTAKSDHGGVQLLSHIDGGLNFGVSNFTIRPFESIDYITGTENSYTENGAGILDLHVDKSNSVMLRNEAGVQFAGCFCLRRGKWMVSPKISWVREVRIHGSEYTAEFVGAEENSFTVNGYFPNRSLVSPGLSVTGSFMEDLLTVGLYYNGEFKGNYSDHSYGGQVRFGF